MKKIDGKTIHRKSTTIEYFSSRRIHLEYRPLASPKCERVAWFYEDGREVGLSVSKRLYDQLDVPETVRDNLATRKEWQRQRRRQATICDFVHW